MIKIIPILIVLTLSIISVSAISWSGGVTTGTGGNPFNQTLNTTSDVQFNNVTITSWFNGLFNWTINSISNIYLQFNGNELTFNETQLNRTIINLAGGASGGNQSFNQTFTDNRYIPINANSTQPQGNSEAGWVNGTFIIRWRE